MLSADKGSTGGLLMLKALRSEKGAITISDILIVLVSVVFIGAVAVPFMLGQQADMNQRAASIAARSIAAEVETFLLTHPEDEVPAEVVFGHNPAIQALVIPLVTVAGTDDANVQLTLSNGISLPVAEPGNPTLAKANIIRSRNNYCIAVRSFGQTAYHNQNGPASSCSEAENPLETAASTEETVEETVSE